MFLAASPTPSLFRYSNKIISTISALQRVRKEVTYQTRKTVFGHICKHREQNLKHEA